jgi:catechol 2,3-dioxygenase-like lactoylglutathione lyase family enzyme
LIESEKRLSRQDKYPREGEAMTFSPAELDGFRTAKDVPFRIRKIGHVVLRASNLRKSVDFYAGILGFAISDIYPEEMVPGGMIFMRCNPDHHGVALVGGMPGPSEKRELHHFAFEVDTLDEVFLARKRLRELGVPIVFEGRRRAGVQIAVEFLDPDGHHLEIYWGLDRVGADGRVRPKDEWREAHTLEDALANPPPGQSVHLKDPTLIERR